MRPPAIVFTDLDGTLLDLRSYSPAAARDTLRRVLARGLPVVFCSSKTAAEQQPLRAELGVEASPYIVENGSAVIVPAAAGLAPDPRFGPSVAAGERICVLGLPFATIRERLARITARAGLPLTGYSDIALDRVAALTGLAPAAAARARQRAFSETLIDEHPAEIWRTLELEFEREGLLCRHGGRFHTVTGSGGDKGRAVRLVADLYAQTFGAAVPTIGIGDSANDAAMLAAVDRAYLVAHADGTWADLAVPALRRTAQPGPHGWTEALSAELLTV